MRPSLGLIWILPLMLCSVAIAEDWPQWRGAHRDGVLREPNLLEELPDGELPRAWSVPIGAGYSGPTVSNGRVYVSDHGVGDETNKVERVLCFDAETGEPIWEHSYDVIYTVSYTAGPRAAITIHDGKALVIGAMGHFKCLDAETGEIIWEHDLGSEYELRMPIWGITAAPMVHEDLVLQIVAGKDNACVVAFDLETGKERWRALDERAGYSAPILIKQGAQEVAVFWTGDSVTGLDPKSGKVFWTVPMQSSRMPIGVATPVVDGNHLFVSSFYDGSMLIELDPDQPKATQVWRRVGIDEKNTDSLHCMISTPWIDGDHIYGVDSYGELRCLELLTGDRVWEDTTAVPRARWATIHTFHDGDRQIMLNDQGELLFAVCSPEGFKEQSRTKLLAPTRRQLNQRGGVTWAHPAIANGVIYARSDKELVAAPLSKQP